VSLSKKGNVGGKTACFVMRLGFCGMQPTRTRRLMPKFNLAAIMGRRAEDQPTNANTQLEPIHPSLFVFAFDPTLIS